MDLKYLTFATILLFGLGLAGLRAQQVVTTAGGSGTGSGGKITYTVGQLAYTSLTGIGGIANNSVQIPFEILIGTGIEEARNISLEFSAYPNPVIETLHLKVGDFDIKNLSYLLYAPSGKLVSFQKLNSKETSIPMENLPSSTYFLKIMYKQDNSLSEKEIKTFKIIKN